MELIEQLAGIMLTLVVAVAIGSLFVWVLLGRDEDEDDAEPKSRD